MTTSTQKFKPATYPQQLDDPSVWTAADYANDRSWVYHLTKADISELEAAANHTADEPLFGAPAASFPLPAFGETLARLAHEVDHGRGFVMLRGLPVARYSRARINAIYAGIGLHLGRVITQNSSGARIGEVTNRGTSYGQPGHRGHTSNGQLLPHCDSGDVVALLCVNNAAAGGESQIASSATVYNTIAVERPDLIAPLATGFRINLAGKGPTGAAEECTNNIIPVFSYFAGLMSCRYNRKQIEEGARYLGIHLTDREREAIARVGETAMRDGIRLDMDFQPGDIQLLNNHCILHARAAYQDEGRGHRLLLRMWINTPGSRPLAPEFADRLNTGPRGEVAVLN